MSLFAERVAEDLAYSIVPRRAACGRQMMALSVRYASKDGRETTTDHQPSTLDSAVALCLDLADAFGVNPQPVDQEIPKWVMLYDGEKMKFQVSVLKGGLIPTNGDKFPAT